MSPSAVERGPGLDDAYDADYAQADNQYYYSQKHHPYPTRPRTASHERPLPAIPSPSHSPTTSRPPPIPYQSHSYSTDDSSDSSHYRRAGLPPRSSSREQHNRPFTPTYAGNIANRPSEASRLRALESSYRSQSPDSLLSADNFSRPRTAQAMRRAESPHTFLHSQTFPSSRAESPGRVYTQTGGRSRGASNSSAQSNLTTNTLTTATTTSVPLRPSASIPDYNSADRTYHPRQRNMGNMTYRVGGYNRPPSNNSMRRDPIPRTTLDNEESRSSFRSALTTGSSYLDASGTERSSVLTKSSSRTSIGKDEGMSVDDAIGMYESGFVDSEVEDDFDEKRIIEFHPSPLADEVDLNDEALDDEKMSAHETVTVRVEVDADVQGDDSEVADASDPASGLLPPPSRIIARDSAAIFRPDTGKPLAPPASYNQPIQNHIQYDHNGGAMIDRSKTIQQNDIIPDGTRDRYGFKKKSQYISIEEYDRWNGPYTEYLERRKGKWVTLLTDANLNADHPEQFPAKSTRVKRFIRKGIPPEWRGAAWWWYAGGPAILAKHQGLYHQLMAMSDRGGVNPTDEEIIERDLNRTFPDNLKFKPESSANDPPQPVDINNPGPETDTLKSLRRVLRAFSIYNPKIGYCQSLNFLAGLLLLFMEEEKAFWMLNIITRVYLPGTHEVNLEGANVDLGVLMMSVKDSMPAVWAKIGGELDGTSGDGKVSMRLPPITLCTTAWFMSCFIGTLPIETTLRVWDSFFFEGSKTLFRIALTIFKLGEPEIKAVSDPMEIFQVVQTIPRKLIDANMVLETCFRKRGGFGNLSQSTIEHRRAERRAGYAAERAMANGQRPVSRKRTLFRRGAKESH